MISIIAVEGLAEIIQGDDLGSLIAARTELRDGDVLVVSQKVVSKAEGAVVDALPGEGAAEARRAIARDQAARVVADTPWVLVVETGHGFVCANAGIDASNAGGRLTLLPADPDRSARSIRASVRAAAGVDVAVIIADTFGRPWRLGQTDVAIGVAGLDPVRDERGLRDRDGHVLDVTEAAIADELAGAADLVRNKVAGIPAVVIRGAVYRPDDDATARRLVRPASEDLFRRGRGMLARALAEIGDTAHDEVRTFQGTGPVAEHDLDLVRRIEPDLDVLAAGPPTRLRVGDGFRAGLVVAALMDLDYEVRWEPGTGGLITVSGGSERR